MNSSNENFPGKKEMYDHIFQKMSINHKTLPNNKLTFIEDYLTYHNSNYTYYSNNSQQKLTVVHHKNLNTNITVPGY